MEPLETDSRQEEEQEEQVQNTPRALPHPPSTEKLDSFIRLLDDLGTPASSKSTTEDELLKTKSENASEDQETSERVSPSHFQYLWCASLISDCTFSPHDPQIFYQILVQMDRRRQRSTHSSPTGVNSSYSAPSPFSSHLPTWDKAVAQTQQVDNVAIRDSQGVLVFLVAGVRG